MAFEQQESARSATIIHSFIRSSYFYSTSSSPLLLRGSPDTARILCRSFTPKRHGQLKDLPKVPTWRLERDSNPQPFGRKATNLSMNHHAPRMHRMKTNSRLKLNNSRKPEFVLKIRSKSESSGKAEVDL